MCVLGSDRALDRLSCPAKGCSTKKEKEVRFDASDQESGANDRVKYRKETGATDQECCVSIVCRDRLLNR